MSVSLSIKGVPDSLAGQLRARAEGIRRSLQRELMTIIEAAVREPAPLQPSARASTATLRPARRAPTAESSQAVSTDAGDPPHDDGLRAELDAIVAGSRRGDAPLLTREQLNDRRLQRELDYESRRADAQAAASGDRA